MLAEAAVGAVFEELLNAVLKITKMAVMFRETLDGLGNTLLKMKPVIEEMNQYNIKLGRPEELESLIMQMKEGTKLVYRCSKISKINWGAKIHYQKKLETLHNSLQRFVLFHMQTHISRDLKNALLTTGETALDVKEIRKNQKETHFLLTELLKNHASYTTFPDEHQIGQIFDLTMCGKKCYMLSARSLSIAWGDSPKYWKKWSFAPLGRSLEVAELVSVCWLEMKGRIKSGMLSPNTWYEAYLVFKESSDGAYGFENQPVEVSVGVGRESDGVRRTVYLVAATTKRRLGVEYPKERGNGWSDGWMEVKLGDFFNAVGEDRDVNIEVKEIKDCWWKGGLIILGIDISPPQLNNLKL